MTDGAKVPELSTLHLQWLLGDWPSLAAVRMTQLAHRADGQTLLLFAIVGCQQCGMYEEAATLVKQAMSMGCSREEIARWMLAGVHNSLGRACSVVGETAKSMEEFRQSIALAPGGVDSEELARARSSHQSRLIERDNHLTVSPQMDRSTSGGRLETFRKPATGITSYAQNFEDVMLWRALGTISNGFYLDVGAQDPIVDSVSKAFYEKGWRGVHVEPTATYANLLRLDRPDELVLQVAISDHRGSMVFYEIPKTGISTGDSEVARGHSARGFTVHEINVPCMTLAEVFDEVGDRDIHWLKVDVEAMERVVLQGWSDAKHRPWIVVVESTLPLTETASFEDWESLVMDRGYINVYFDGLNRYYLAEERAWLAPAFQQPPNVFDDFVLSGKASASFCRRAI